MSTILVVDDRPTNRDVLVTLLRYRGHRLLEAADGAEALALARAEVPDLIISDILMPTMDGYELVRQLRASEVTAPIPVIFYSAHYLKNEAAKLAESCGVSAILTKPAEPEVVLRTVETVLGLVGSPEAPVAAQEFDREHLQLLTNKLSQTTEELRVRNERLMMLIELSQQLSSTIEPEHILKWLCRGAREVIGARYAAVGILDDEETALRHFLTSGMSAAVVARLGTPPARAGTLGTLLDDRRPQRFRIAEGNRQRSGLPAIEPPPTSFLGVPVLSAAKVIGWLCLLDKLGTDEFDDQDEGLALTVAAQLGRLYENRRLVIDLQQRTVELEQEIAERKQAQEDLAERARLAALAAEVGVALTHGGTLPAILQGCAEALVRGLDAAFARIWTLNQEENVLELQGSAGMYTHLDGPHSRVAVGSFKIGLIAADREPHLTNQVIGDPRVSDQEWAEREGMVAFAGYPLLVEDQLVGVVAMFARHSLTRFTLDALASVADEIALGTQRKRAALAQAEEADVSMALARVGREMISSLDTPVILDRLCHLTAEVLACDASCTLLWRPEDNVFEAIAGFSSSAEEEEVMRVIRLPRSTLPGPSSSILGDDLIAVGTILPSDLRAPAAPAPMQLGIVLHRGADLIGLQVAYWRDQPQPLTPVQRRIAQGVAQIASLGVAHARVIDELARANRLKSDFVSTMSHELRTPLNAIIGYNDLLLDGAFGTLSTEQLQILGDVRRSSQHLLDLVSATLDLSRFDKGDLPVEAAEVALPDLVARLEAETVTLHEKAGVQFVCRMRAQQLRLRTDASKLVIVLRNLIGNAFKFTEAGHVTFVVGRRGNGVEFVVSDTGIGIAPQDHTIIFEPFRQVEPYLTRRYGGVGLGLYIVHRLVEMLGGTVRVRSGLGRGATFRVWLPLEVASESVPADSTRPLAEAQSKSQRQSQRSTLDEPAERLFSASGVSARPGAR